VPLTLTVGLCKEINLPDCNLRVSCGVEVEVDVTSLEDIDLFDRVVEQAFFVCRDAVDGELRRNGADQRAELAINSQRFAMPLDGRCD
jgi:hypothetical protein